MMLTDKAAACGGTTSQSPSNINSSLIACGLVLGAATRIDGGDDLILDPDTRWKIPLYSCATAMKATIKTVEFQYNGTGLDALKVRSLKPKTYEDGNEPVWGVENVPRQSIDTAPPMWGIIGPNTTVSQSTLDGYDISSIKAESLYLPGYMDQNYPLLRGLNSVPVGTGQNLPGVEFYNQALMTAYTINVAGFNPEADYSGARSLALYAKWQRLLQSADGAASIINLVWTDIATNAVVGTKGWGLNAAASRISSSISDSSPVSSNTNVPVTVYGSHIRYQIPYAVPAFVTLAVTTALLCLLIALLIMRRTGLKRLRMFLESTTIGRVLSPFIQADDATSETSSSKDWVKSVGQQKVMITPEAISIDSVSLGQRPGSEAEDQAEQSEKEEEEATRPLTSVNTL